MKGAWIYFLLMPGFLEAAEPPPYAPDPTIKALNAAVEACGQGLNSMQTTPVEIAREALLKKAVDQLLDGAARSAEAGRSLSSETQAPLAAALTMVKGKGATTSMDSRTEAVTGSTRALRRQWNQLTQEVENALSELEKQAQKPQAQDPKKAAEAAKERNEKEEALEVWRGRLAGADKPLTELEALLIVLAEAGSRTKGATAGMERAAVELEAATSALAKTASSLQQAGHQAKQSIDALGSPPENVARTRVYQKFEPLIDGQRSVYVSADAARNRTNSFASAYAAFLKSWKNYEAVDQDANRRLSGLMKLLSEAAAALPRLKA